MATKKGSSAKTTGKAKKAAVSKSREKAQTAAETRPPFTAGTETKAPLATVKDRFGDKAKLVDEIVSAVTLRPGESRADLKTRLAKVSNGKLLRLHARTHQASAR